jgi:hypothetical protein
MIHDINLFCLVSRSDSDYNDSSLGLEEAERKTVVTKTKEMFSTGCKTFIAIPNYTKSDFYGD